MRLTAVMAFNFMIRITFLDHLNIFRGFFFLHSVTVEQCDLFIVFGTDLFKQLHQAFFDRIRRDHQIPVMDADDLAFRNADTVQFDRAGRFGQFS